MYYGISQCQGSYKYNKRPVTCLNLRSRLWFVSRQVSVGLWSTVYGLVPKE